MWLLSFLNHKDKTKNLKRSGFFLRINREQNVKLRPDIMRVKTIRKSNRI